LSITDTGHGIPQDQFDKILAPFFTTKKQGTGLGLSICMRLVKANDGVMEIESVEGRGTVVTLVFLAENKVKERGCNDHE
jgi:signal transduction histidine kinase